MKVCPIVISESYFFRITQSSLEKCTYFLCCNLVRRHGVYPVFTTASSFADGPSVYISLLSSTNQPESVSLSLPACLQLRHSAAASQTTQRSTLFFVRCAVNIKTRFLWAGRGGDFITRPALSIYARVLHSSSGLSCLNVRNTFNIPRIV